MNFFAGLAKGWSEAQGKHNDQIMDFLNQKNRTMATLYGHMAERPDIDPELQTEFMNRAFAFGSANPIIDPKGYKNLSKMGDIHELIDQHYQKKLSEKQQAQYNQPERPQGLPQQGYETSLAPGKPDEFASLQGMGNEPSTPEPQIPPQRGQLTMSPPPLPAQDPNAGPMTMDQWTRAQLPPEPDRFNTTGIGLNPEYEPWKGIYSKKMESTVQTPAYMQDAMGSPFMPSAAMNPYANLQGRMLTATQSGAARGLKLVNGQWVPMEPAEQSLLNQSRLKRDQSQMELNHYTQLYRQAVTKKDEMLTGAYLERIAIAKANLAREQMETAAKLFGINPQTGKPFPGQVMIDDGMGNFMPIGTMNYRGSLPTSAEQGKAGAGVSVIQHGQNMLDFAKNPNNADLFGKLSGRWKEFMAGHYGTGDPRESGLRADIRSMASLLSPLHGFRSAKAADEFRETLQQSNSPEAWAAAVEKYMYMAEHIYEEGMPNIAGADGKAVKRSQLAHDKTAGPPKTEGGATQKDYMDAAMASGWDGKTRPVPAEFKQKAEALLRKQGKIK